MSCKISKISNMVGGWRLIRALVAAVYDDERNEKGMAPIKNDICSIAFKMWM